MKRNSFIIVLGLIIVVLSFGLVACERTKEDGQNQRNNPPKNGSILEDLINAGRNRNGGNQLPTNAPTPRPTMRVSTDMPFDQLVTFSRNLLDDFWSKTFAANKWQYRTATGFHYYTETVQTACGPSVMENAFYCPRSHTIYYDDAFLRDIYNKDGDFAVVTVLAHEWGHLAQGNLGIIGGNQQYFAIDTELQADCFAGAFAKYVDENKYLEDKDLDEGGEKLFKIGDYRPWFDPQAHGRPLQRIDSYLNGWKYGIRACFSKAELQQFQPRN